MTRPIGQTEAAGEPVIFFPASAVVQVQVPPFCQAAASPPLAVVAKSSVWPWPLMIADGTPVRLAGLLARVFHLVQDRPFQLVTAALADVVTQNSSTARPASMNGAGELAQLPPMFCHAVQCPLPLARRWRVTSTRPSAPVAVTSSGPMGSRMAAGSVPARIGSGSAGSGLPHSQSFRNPACCQACTIWPEPDSAKMVSPPSASGATEGLLTIVFGERPRRCIADQVRLPTGACQECRSVFAADLANHSAVPFALMAIEMRGRLLVGGGGVTGAPPRFTSSL